MSDVATSEEEPEAPKKSKKGLLFGLIGAIVLGGGGFYATYSGLLLGSGGDSGSHEEETASHGGGGGGHGGGDEEEAYVSADVAFIELPPLTISLGRFATSPHLRFHAHLEVSPDNAKEIEHLSPRILDVLNTYLRAVGESELEDPASMNRLRAQMLRRVQVVAGEGNVKDLLITEFVLY